jgi:hypothetical protein
MTPLDSGTKTGKIVDRIIKILPADLEIVKSNIINNDSLVSPSEIQKYTDEWWWTHLPVSDDIIILMGAMTQSIYKTNLKNTGSIIRVAHPASRRSNTDIDKYILDVSVVIGKKLARMPKYWFINKFDMGILGQRMHHVEFTGNDVVNFIEQYLSDSKA